MDHDAKMRSKEDAKQQDGTQGGGMGVKEMRERKMAGQGLPSPQVSAGAALVSEHGSVQRWAICGGVSQLTIPVLMHDREETPKPKLNPRRRLTRSISRLPLPSPLCLFAYC